MHQWLDVGSSVASLLWKEFGCGRGDARLCIQFEFDLGKRIDVESSVYFLFFSEKDCFLSLDHQLINTIKINESGKLIINYGNEGTIFSNEDTI